jgi:hypothetical protein
VDRGQSNQQFFNNSFMARKIGKEGRRKKMTRMKKGLAALAAACFLFVGSEKAQAVVGIPDDVPGNSLLFPFFKVNPNRPIGGAQDTLFVITNTSSVDPLIVHISLWSVRSEHVYDFNVILTHHDVFSCSLYDILFAAEGCASEGVAQAPPIAAELLEVDPDLLAGYITADVVTASTSLLPTSAGYPFGSHNVLIGHEYIVDLPNGSATGLNAVSIEDTTPTIGHPASPAYAFTDGFYSANVVDSLERFSGVNGKAAQIGASIIPPFEEEGFDLIVRYFSASALEGRTEIWLWKECNSSDGRDLEGDADGSECRNSSTLNVTVWDEDENAFSITFSFPDEVNFVDLQPYINPNDNGGWIRFPIDPEVQAAAYALQFASLSTDSLRWDAVFPAHRQYTDYIGGDAEE